MKLLWQKQEENEFKNQLLEIGLECRNRIRRVQFVDFNVSFQNGSSFDTNSFGPLDCTISNCDMI